MTFVTVVVMQTLLAATCSGRANPRAAASGDAAMSGVVIRGMTMRYGDVAAVRGLDLG